MLKHNDNLEGKEKVKYDLYKILRMSVLLNQNETDELTLSKFKEASLNIDKMISDEYNEKIDTMFYDTMTLEEEEKRLKDLVAFIKERMEKRKSLLEDYKNVTSRDLNDLEYIEKSFDLDLYKERLDTIKNYLDSSKLIEVNENDLETLKEKLVKEYDLKSENEIKNIKLEEKLYDIFVNALYEMDLYSSCDFANVDKEIEDLEAEINETKEQKDTFETAFNNLKSSGITGDLELEYASYVENSKKNYYYVKEKEIILKLYKLLEIKENEYSNLFSKREDVKELLQERILLRDELSIKEKDYLYKVSDLVTSQEEEIESEKVNVDNINILTERIKLKENRLEDLRKEVKKPEILAILQEYGLIDTYNHNDILEEYEEISEVEEEVKDDLLSELMEEVEQESVEKEIQPNQIKEVLEVPSMNFGLSRLKSISVMKRVADMLGINAKKEEIKEEVKEIKEVPLEKEVVKEEIKTENKEEDLFWTPVEFVDMKKDTEEEIKENDLFKEEIFIPEVPAVDKKEENIFPNNNQELIFPEPTMPEMNVLPQNNEDKFMWPDNMETFDINGIFPS